METYCTPFLSNQKQSKTPEDAGFSASASSRVFCFQASENFSGFRSFSGIRTLFRFPITFRYQAIFPVSDHIVPGRICLGIPGIFDHLNSAVFLYIILVIVDDQLLGLDADPGSRLHGTGDEHVGADDGALADGRITAEDGGSGIDGDIVFDRGVALGAL